MTKIVVAQVRKGNGEGKRRNELTERVREEPRAKKCINNKTLPTDA